MISADGAAAFGPVEVVVFVGESASGLKNWHGSFVLPKNLLLTGSETLAFTFADAKTGSAIIRRVQYDSSGKSTVAFIGNGPLE